MPSHPLAATGRLARLGSLLPLSILCFVTTAQALPLTAVIGVDPDNLDFRVVTLGECGELATEVFNDGDPGSVLEVTDISLSGDAMSLVDPPATPFTVSAGNAGELVLVRACALHVGVEIGWLTIEASNAPNSPLDVRVLIVGNRAPICNAGGPYAGDLGDQIDFDGTASNDLDGTIVAYDWEFGDGDTGSGPSPIHTYDGGGVFEVTLCVTDDRGAQVCCTTSADIDPGPGPPYCNAGGPYAGIIGTLIAFDGTASSAPAGSIVSYTWMFGDGTTGEGPTPTHVYTHGGIYSAHLTLVDNLGATSGCATRVDIDSPIPPVCNAGGTYRADTDEALQLDGTGSIDPDGTITAYDWSFGDGDTGSGAMPTHTYDRAGNYAITLCVTDNEGGQRCCGSEAIIVDPWSYNEMTTLALHAVVADLGPCQIEDPCPWGATVNVAEGDTITAYLLARNYSDIAGLQTAFDFGSFEFLFGQWDCQDNQVNGHVPTAPGGPIDGTLATVFDCIAGGETQVIGRLHMIAHGGCLTQIQSTFPFGIHVINCLTEVTSLGHSNLGSICVDWGGQDACEPIFKDVEQTTWGSIKARFRGR